ncbi:MAG: N-acetyl-gamma-glutamyl-phosphate reductase [Trueperaceae bacterium]|nr:N-acetyl-gamma-glutamyl-phosphate reductase [Trueperaceae bacterium]
MPLQVGILGANGYGGAGLVSRLLAHPETHLAALASRQYLGQPVEAAWPQFAGLIDATFVDADDAVAACDVLFTATPHGATAPLVHAARSAGKRVVDLSADFRLDARTYATWYGEHPHPQWLDEAIYGLPELHRAELAGATVVASPGCNATAVILALAPLAAAGLLGSTPSATIVAGASGAGRGLDLGLHYAELDENARPYKVAGTHRHTGEIEVVLGRVLAQGKRTATHGQRADVRIAFNPVLVPMARGVLATALARPEGALDGSTLLERYRDFYADDPFVHVQGDLPQTKAVASSDRALVSVRYDERTGTVVAFCALDNLGKGASGQAVQAFNLVHGFPEALGLRLEGVWP